MLGDALRCVGWWGDDPHIRSCHRNLSVNGPRDAALALSLSGNKIKRERDLGLLTHPKSRYSPTSSEVSLISWGRQSLIPVYKVREVPEQVRRLN